MSEEARIPGGLVNEIQALLQQGCMEIDGERSIVFGWAVVIEWIDPKGGRWLSQLSRGADGTVLPSWQLEGYLHNALYSPKWERNKG
jgi:hypothetical protein